MIGALTRWWGRASSMRASTNSMGAQSLSRVVSRISCYCLSPMQVECKPSHREAFLRPSTLGVASGAQQADERCLSRSIKLVNAWTL
jgi:hypothetical protein